MSTPSISSSASLRSIWPFPAGWVIILAVIGITLATLAAVAGQTAERSAAIDAGRPITSYMQPGRQFTQWDGWRYEEIIRDGYFCHHAGDPPEVKQGSVMPYTYPDGHTEPRLKNVVWYPLYPALGWCVAALTGLSAAGALTVVSQLCAAAGAVVFFAVARRHLVGKTGAGNGLEGLETESGLPERAAVHANLVSLLAVALLLFAPFAIFLYANFTESLFVLLLALFIYFLQGKNWWAAAIVAAVASASRSQGVFFGPILALCFLVRSPRPWPARLGLAAVMGFISALGLMAYMAYLYRAFGDPLVFAKVQTAWNVGINPGTLAYAANPWHLVEHIGRMIELMQRKPAEWPRVAEALAIPIAPLLMVLGTPAIARRLRLPSLSMELQIIGWIMWALPYVSNSIAGNPPGDSQWMSMGRFMTVVLPLQLVVAGVLARFGWALVVVLLGSAGLFWSLAYAYGSGTWVG